MVTATRRGLALTAYSEAPLVSGLVAFILFPTVPALLVTGIVLSLLFGAPAGLALWAGRREFGPRLERAVPRATLAFVVLLASLLLAFFQVTSVFPESSRLRDLYAPWFFLALALLADAGGMLLLLAPLTTRRRWALHAVWALALVGTAVHVVRGQAAIAGFVERSGGFAAVPAEASSYARDFVATVVREWAVALLALRVGFWPALYDALVGVAEAEREAELQAGSAGGYAVDEAARAGELVR